MPGTKSTSITKPEPSALTTLISSTASSDPLSASTTQILHNLQHQHLWTSLQVHDLKLPSSNSSSPAAGSVKASSEDNADTPYLISGIPPHRVYTHPDEQLYLLERGLREEEIELERLFVLPAVKGQSWSLRKMAAVFDSLPDETEIQAAEVSLNEREETDGSGGVKETMLAEYYEYRKKARLTREWGGKRLLLAMVDRGMGGDGTVVYYVVQEGAVKPRQN
ncbi:hypothetical protein BDV29DRAFT_71788 [Aspergillus leporis]|uniref:tRNA-splicing endonuclease subunit Sen15 domain-containing protein n=1 Tax=Aspergillus leporis TaxID=41062 RepID=A0A5N5WMB2_9EURO|nr:hypothetical protein BDV29DRAFT_71788 [Aspergillus leporis]